MRLADLIALPWSYDIAEHHDDGTYLTARIRELPGLIATGKNDTELSRNLTEAMVSHLGSYLAAGEVPPLPRASQEVSWDVSRDVLERVEPTSGGEGCAVTVFAGELAVA